MLKVVTFQASLYLIPNRPLLNAPISMLMSLLVIYITIAIYIQKIPLEFKYNVPDQHELLPNPVMSLRKQVVQMVLYYFLHSHAHFRIRSLRNSYSIVSPADFGYYS